MFSEQNYQDRNDPRLAYAYNTNQVAACTSLTGNTNCVRPNCGTVITGPGGGTVTSNCFPAGTTAAERANLFCNNQNGTNGNPGNSYGVTWTSTVTAKTGWSSLSHPFFILLGVGPLRPTGPDLRR